jgi:hypothetical protein
MALVVVGACLSYTKGLTIALQSRSIDIFEAYLWAQNVTAVLKDVRHNIEYNHSGWYKSAVKLKVHFLSYHGDVANKYIEKISQLMHLRSITEEF